MCAEQNSVINAHALHSDRRCWQVRGLDAFFSAFEKKKLLRSLKSELELPAEMEPNSRRQRGDQRAKGRGPTVVTVIAKTFQEK